MHLRIEGKWNKGVYVSDYIDEYNQETYNQNVFNPIF